MGRHNPEHNDTAQTEVRQLGATQGHISLGKGGLNYAKHVTGRAKGGKEGDVVAALESDELKRDIYADVASGKKEFIFDMKKDAKMSDPVVEKFKDLRDKLNHDYGATLTLTDVDATRAEELRRQGMETKGLKLVTEDKTAEMFRGRASEEDNDARTADKMVA